MKKVLYFLVTAVIVAPSAAWAANPQSPFASGVAKMGLCDIYTDSGTEHPFPCHWVYLPMPGRP